VLQPLRGCAAESLALLERIASLFDRDGEPSPIAQQRFVDDVDGVHLLLAVALDAQQSRRDQLVDQAPPCRLVPDQVPLGQAAADVSAWVVVKRNLYQVQKDAHYQLLFGRRARGLGRTRVVEVGRVRIFLERIGERAVAIERQLAAAPDRFERDLEQRQQRTLGEGVLHQPVDKLLLPAFRRS
jgi:hypothetical protein